MFGSLDGRMTDLLAQPHVDLASRSRGIRTSVAVSVDGLAMTSLAAIAGILYLVNLTVSGYANTYYAMAAQAASQSWSAMFFGALDSQGFITIDKPPLATWLMGLSVKVLGLSSWSILLPEALLGIGSVLVLYLAVRRSFGSTAALIAGTLMAVMPVAVLIFRYDNPDALLTFLLVTAAWALGRGLEHGRLRWALLAASLVGAAFLTKYLQAYLVLPGFALVWLVSAPVSLRRRLVGLLAAAATVAVTSFWWVAIVELIPAGSRPYIGGSTTNSPLELLLGYDGLGRIFGSQPGGSGLGSAVDGFAFGGGPGGAGTGGPTFSGTPGLLRLFNDQLGGQIAWLIPAALLALAVGIAIHLRAGRTDRRLAGYVLWGSWLAVHVVVFSFMSGIIHSYYTVILAPALAALVGGATVELWRRRATDPRAGTVLAAGLVATGLTAFAILDRAPTFAPGLAFGILALSAAGALVVSIPAGLMTLRVARIAIAIGASAVLAGPLAYAADTMATASAGGDPSAGPQSAASFGGPGGNQAGALGGTATTDQALVDYLVANQGSARWLVAATGSQVAAGIQLAAGLPVLTMGGFTGSDPAPTLAELQSLVRSGQLRYVLLGGGPGGGPGGPGGPGGFRGPGGPAATGDRSAWISASCAAVSTSGLGASGLYDCSGAAGG